MLQKNLLNGSTEKEFSFCACGLIEGHRQKCLSFKVGMDKHKIGKYSGKSKTPYGTYEER